MQVILSSERVLKSDFELQLTLPTAFDEAGIRMLDSIREIFDIIGIRLESVGFNFARYKEFKQLVAALKAGKCPVISVPNSYLNPACTDGFHAMVATGIKHIRGAQFIQMKNSHADNPNAPGKSSITLGRFCFMRHKLSHCQSYM